MWHSKEQLGRQERVAETEKSWKSYTCFSAGYLKKTDESFKHPTCKNITDFIKSINLYDKLINCNYKGAIKPQLC